MLKITSETTVSTFTEMLRLNHCVGISKTKFKTVGLLFGTVIIKERRGRKDLSNLHVKDGDVITLEAGSSWRWKASCSFVCVVGFSFLVML